MIRKYQVLLLFVISSVIFGSAVDYVEFDGVCPQPRELIKNKDSIWLTRSDWRSFNPSFIDKITVFLGAQWQGEHIGQLLCRYSDRSSVTFPIIMQAPFLSKMPSTKSWGKDPRHFGTFNCHASNVDQCPVIGLRKKQQNLESTEALKSFLQSIKK